MNMSQVAFVFLAFVSMQATAGEWSTDAYAGIGLTANHNAHVNLPEAQLTAVHKDLRFDNALVLGIRETFWFSPYFGLGLDLTHFFGPDQKKQISTTVLCIEDSGCSTSSEQIQKFNNHVTTLAPIVSLIYPLNIAGLRVQPYMGVGPLFTIAKLRDTDNFIPPRQSSTSRSVGIKAQGGLRLCLNQYFSLFTEYQFNSFPVHTTYHNERVVHGITLGKTEGKETFTIHTIALGLGFSI